MIDTFMVGLEMELDMLNLRLHELDSVVDYFVIAESNVTGTGAPKEMVFWNRRSRFAPFLHKIVHVFTSEVPKDTKKYPSIIYLQRDAIPQALATLDMRDCDLVLLSDLDEIPRPSLVPQLVKMKALSNKRQRLYMVWLQYNALCGGNRWAKAVVAKWAAAKQYAGRWSEFRAVHYRKPYRKMIAEIPNAGWHLSNFFSVEDIVAKYRNYMTYAIQLLDKWKIEQENAKGEAGILQDVRACQPCSSRKPADLPKFIHLAPGNPLACNHTLPLS